MDSPSLAPDIARDLPESAEQVYDLLSFVTERGPKVDLSTRGRAVSAEFMQDLDLAGKRAIKSMARLVATASSGRSGLFDALLGCPAHERCARDEAALLDLIAPFIPGESQGWGCVAGLPVFRAAVCGTESTTQDGIAALPRETACAVGNDLETVFVSADLGFRDLFVMTQIGAVHLLVLRALDAGLPMDRMAALHDVCALLNCDAPLLGDDHAFVAISVRHDGRTIPALHTARCPDT